MRNDEKPLDPLNLLVVKLKSLAGRLSAKSFHPANSFQSLPYSLHQPLFTPSQAPNQAGIFSNPKKNSSAGKGGLAPFDFCVLSFWHLRRSTRQIWQSWVFLADMEYNPRSGILCSWVGATGLLTIALTKRKALAHNNLPRNPPFQPPPNLRNRPPQTRPPQAPPPSPSCLQFARQHKNNQNLTLSGPKSSTEWDGPLSTWLATTILLTEDMVVKYPKRIIAMVLDHLQDIIGSPDS